SIYLVEPAINSEDFRLMKGIDESVQIFNFAGKLNNAGERLEIKKPAPTYYNDNDSLIIPYIITEAVRFNDKSPWPDADGNGNVLQRIDINAYANDPANWMAVPAGISIENYILSNATIGVPFNHQFDVSGGIAPFIWNIENGLLPEGLNLNGSKGTIIGTPTETGTFEFKLAVTDQTGVSAQTSFKIEVFANTPAVAVNDAVQTNENFNINIDILNNDIDNDNERSHWNIDITQTPANGTIVLNNNQIATYLPNNGFTGNDSFKYRITDYSNQSEATVFVEVTPYILTSTIEKSVSEASDDAEENIFSQQIWTNSTDLELCYDPNPGGEQIVGIRFQNIQIAQGTSIKKAYLRFTTDEATSDQANLDIFAENSINAQSFNTNNLISTRPLTNSSVNWQPEAWLTANESSIKQQTPDLSELVQQIIDRNEWEQGNAMAFVIKGSGSRVAHAYDGSPADAPKLFIEYGTISGESTTPVAQITAPEQFIIYNQVSLSGTASYSADGRPLNFLWTMVSKPQNSQSSLTNLYSAQPSFTPDMFGEYRISLTVNNGVNNSEAAILTINIGNMAPIANAGNDQTVLVGDIISLNGNRSYDPEGNDLTYTWKIASAPQGSEALIINQNHPQTT
ncbi:MAG TPA: Ig-like domain-containing protein, partial [Prolixibacteraceae bacterium]|nr:Ig-like domain-containing protein [Prolixibacteraceae bacterium]